VRFVSSFTPLLEPIALRDIALGNSSALDQYEAVFVPGGHSPLIDLIGNVHVGRVLWHFWNASKPMGFICHGPLVAIAMGLGLAPNDWPLIGKHMTVFSTAEEKAKEHSWNDTIGYYPAEVLAARGANVSQGAMYLPNVVLDGQLVTGQNPQSAQLFGTVFTKLVTSLA